MKFIPFFILLISTSLFSQTEKSWEKDIHDRTTNFFETKKMFEEYWKDKEISKGQGYTPFMRMANWIEARISPNGDVSTASPLKVYNEYRKYLSLNKSSSNACQGNWTSVGPTMLKEISTWDEDNIGRINCVGIDPNNSSTFHVGSPAGGLWSTNDGGISYNNNTDQLDYFGFSSISVDPSNSNIIYAGTGDKDSYDMPTLGLIKSIDGGTSWQHIPSFPNLMITKILINPFNPQSLTVSTYSGLFKSYDGGNSWMPTFTTERFLDLEYKPGDTTTVYATSDTDLYKSTDGGLIFNSIPGTGVNYASISDALIAVSNSDPNFVAVATINNSDDIMVYTSNNQGITFTSNGMAPISSGQGWYNFGFDVSPLNKSEIIVGAVWAEISLDGGATFNPISSGIHADIHEIKYSPDGSLLYVCTDGGIYRGSNSSTLNPLNGNMDISQIYSLGVSKSSGGKVVIGMQDNGSQFVTSPTQSWDRFGGADGMECFFNPTNDNIIYFESQNGFLKKSTNNGASYTTILSGITGSAFWENPWCLDENSPWTLFTSRYNNFFKSTNSGTNWSLHSTFPSSGQCREFELAPNNSSIIYALLSSPGMMVKSNDGGATWTNLPVTYISIPRYIAINPTDSNDVIICLGNNVDPVRRSLDGGQTWTNLSAGLPNVSINTAVFDTDPTKGFYVGTDAGVYYYQQLSGSYISYNNGLPLIPVNEIEIDTISKELYAATYGRGLWKTDLFDANASCPPIAKFTIDTPACNSLQVTFTNSSFLNPTSYNWSFPGGSPSTSTLANPTITFSSTGTYTATLVAINSHGTDTSYQTFTLGGVTTFPVSEGFGSSTFPPGDWTLDKNSVDTYNWERMQNYGGFGLSTSCMFFPNWTYNTAGAHHHFITPKLNTSNLNNLVLSFDVAHHQFGSLEDSLLVSVSNDCGVNWTQVYSKGSSQLETAATTGSHIFLPASTEWRKDSINLNYFVPTLLIRFTNVGAYGERIYIDNINLNGAPISTLIEENQENLLFDIYPNPSNSLINIKIEDRNHPFFIFNMIGETLMMKNEVPEQVNLSHLSSGVYLVKIGSTTKKIFLK